MIVILVLVLLEKSLVLITHVDALIKAVIIMKEILSLAKMDATLAIVLLDRSLVQKIRVVRIAPVTLNVLLVIIVLCNHVKLQKVLAL